MAVDDVKVRVVIDALDRASPTVQRTLTTLSRGMRTVGMQMTIVGGVVTGLGALAVRSALGMRSSWALIAAELANVGGNLEAHKSEVDSVVTKWADFTATPVSSMLAALAKMQAAIGGPNGLDAALRALPAAAVAARVMRVPLEEAADLIVAAFMGDKGAIQKLRNFGVALKDEGNTWTDIITAVRSKFEPQVAALVTPFDLVEAAVTNLKDKIGTLITPTLFEPVSAALVAILKNMNEWIDAHPKLASAVATTFFGAGGVVLAFGTALYLAGQLAAAVNSIRTALLLLGSAVLATTGTVGLIVLAVIALAIAVALLVTYWDEVTDAFNTFAGTTAGQVALAVTSLLVPIFGVIASLALLAFNWDAVWSFVADKTRWAANYVIDRVNDMLDGLNTVARAMNAVLREARAQAQLAAKVPPSAAGPGLGSQDQAALEGELVRAEEEAQEKGKG